MKLKEKIIGIIIFFLIILFMSSSQSYAGHQEWKALNYDVTLNSDGSMDVVETWNVSIEETNTLFKRFSLRKMPELIFSNVSVSLVDDYQEEITFTDINKEQYHVDPGCFYGLMIDDYTFEIAWNVGLDDSYDTRIYKIYYTVENAVRVYEDCAELYWQFLSDENEMEGTNITGTVKLPHEVSSIENLKVWAHGNLEGNISRKSKDTVTFETPKVYSNELLEVRVVTTENIYEESTNLFNMTKLDRILEEEQEFADKANKEREEARKELLKVRTINIVVCGFILLVAFKYIIAGARLKIIYCQKDSLKYFRDIPNEKESTPSRAAFLYYFKNKSSTMGEHLSKIFSASILDLSLKKIVEFEPIDDKDVRIILKKDEMDQEVLSLPDDERVVFDIINKAAGIDKTITSKELSKYSKINYETIYLNLVNLTRNAKSYHDYQGKISNELKKISSKWELKAVIYIFLVIIFILYMSSNFHAFKYAPIAIGVLVLAILSGMNASKVCVLSEKGKEEASQWKGLKRYMEDYSLLKEKLVPDIVLWEKYLVYATAFGVSKKLIKQLKVVHPEMFESHEYNNSSYWHIVSNPRFGDDYFTNFSNNLEKAYNYARSSYNIANSSDSDGGGGGGGFSSGGGGRRWRWKLRRTLK